MGKALVSYVNDPWAVQLIGAFLLLEVVCILLYVRARIAEGDQWGPLRRLPFILISATVMLVCAAFFFSLGLRRAESTIYSLALGSGLVLSLLHPVIAVSFFVCNLLLRPWEVVPSGLVLSLPKALAGLSMAAWLLHEVRHSRLHFIWNGTWTLYVAFVLWIFTATLLGGHYPDGMSYFTDRFIPITVVFFLIFNCVRDRLDLKLVLISLIISVAGVTSAAALFTLRSAEVDRLTGGELLGNPNDIASLVVLILPFLLFPLAKRKIIGWAASGAAAAALLYGIHLAQSRGAKLSLIAMAAAYVLLCVKVTWKRLVILAVGALLFAVLLSGSTRSADDLEGSFASRFNYVLTGFRMLKYNPLFGVGIGNYPKEYEKYTLSFDEYGERTAHSSWILVLSETGLPGLMLFGLLFLSVLLRAFRLRRSRPEFFLSMIGYGLAMSFLSHTYLFPPYILFAVVLVGFRVFKEQADCPPQWPLLKIGRVFSVMFVLFLPLSYAQCGETASIAASAGTDKPLGGYEPKLEKTLKLRGARGEILNFLLKVKTGSCVPIGYPSFVRKQERSRAAFLLRLYAMPPITTEQASFPGAFVGRQYDAVVPFQEAGRYCPQAKGQPEWLFGELEIPPWAAPGEYSGKLAFGKAELPLEITVWKMRIPDQPALPFYTEMSTWYNLKGHFGRWENREAELAGKYVLELRRHRMIDLSTSIISPPVKKPGKKPILDLDNEPTAEQSFRNINLRFRPPWAYSGIPAPPVQDWSLEKTAEYFRAVENSLAQINDRRALVFLWDEPQEKDLPTLVKYCKRVREAAPSLKIMVTVPHLKELEGLIDVFSPVMNDFENPLYGGPAGYRNLQAQGKEIWWYVSCMSHGCYADLDPGLPDFVIDRPVSYIRSIAWLSRRYAVDAFFYYFMNYAYQFYPGRDPWRNVWDFSGNGDGTLFYPGRTGEYGLKEEMPIASLRMKAWREASYDAEYLKWMDGLAEPPAWWPGELERLASGLKSWNRDYSEYARVREKIGQYLNSKES